MPKVVSLHSHSTLPHPPPICYLRRSIPIIPAPQSWVYRMSMKKKTKKREKRGPEGGCSLKFLVLKKTKTNTQVRISLKQLSFLKQYWCCSVKYIELYCSGAAVGTDLEIRDSLTSSAIVVDPLQFVGWLQPSIHGLTGLDRFRQTYKWFGRILCAKLCHMGRLYDRWNIWLGHISENNEAQSHRKRLVQTRKPVGFPHFINPMLRQRSFTQISCIPGNIALSLEHQELYCALKA